MAGQRLGRGQRRHRVAEHFADRVELGDVAQRGRGAVGVEIVQRAIDALQRHLHAAHRAFAGWGDHVGAVGGHAIADQLGMDVRAARNGVVVVLQHQHAAATGDDEAVAVLVVRTRGAGRGLVEAGRQRAHRIEHHAHRPVQVFTATGEHDVLRAVADHVRGGADAVRRGGAGGRQRVADALDLVGRGQAGRDRRAHRARHHVRADLAHTTFAQQVDRADLPLAGAATGTGDQAGAQVADLLGAEPGIGDGIAHGQVGEGRRITHEALLLAVDQCVQVEVDTAADLAAQAGFGVVGQGGDARAPIAQRGRNGIQIIAEAGRDAHAGDDDATHQKLPVSVNRPTRRSRAL